MARKRTSDEANTLLWYRMECFKRSRYYEWLRGMLKETEKEGGGPEPASRLEFLASFREMIRSAPVLPIASDGLSWLTVKIALDSPPSLVLALLDRLLKEMHDTDDAVEWILFLRRYGEAVEEILRREPRSALARVLDAARPLRPAKERVHLKNLKLRLEVWDRVKAGADFQRVAKERRLPTSTVRDLYNQAALCICGELPPKKKRPRLLQTFVPEAHDENCPTCRAAQRVEDFCAAKQAYVNQGYGSQRERTIEKISDLPAERVYPGRRKGHPGAE